MAKKGKAKISKVKRNNQTTNKMKKQGKLKLQRHRQKVQKQKVPATPQVEYESDSDSASGEEWADMLDDEEQQYIMTRLAKQPQLLSNVPEKDPEQRKGTKRKKPNKLKPPKPSSDSGADTDSVSSDSDIEDKYEKEMMERPVKKTRPLLPIKTKDGLLEREEECEESESDSEDQPTPAKVPKPSKADATEEEQDSDETDSGVEGTEDEAVSTVQLLAARRDRLAHEKLRIGALCSSLIESPEKKLKNFFPILYLMEERLKDGALNLHSIRKLATLSAYEVFKDILPDYLIRHQDYSNVKLKKDTLALYKYEKELLEFYKRYLQRLEKAAGVLRQKKGDTRKPEESAISLALVSLQCMSGLLVSHPNFNYATNIAQSIVPYLDCRNGPARTVVSEACEAVFGQDNRGEITLTLVRLINQLVKRRSDRLHPQALDCLLALKIKDVDMDAETDIKHKKKQDEKHKKRIVNLSKREKKRAKKLKEVERELLETEAQESEMSRKKHLTEVTKTVFHIYFRLLKTAPTSKLLNASLQGLAKFTHVINLEYYTDLLAILAQLLSNDDVTAQSKLQCISTALSVLSGGGDVLNVDPGRFHAHLYHNMLHCHVGKSHNNLSVIISAISKIASRSRSVSAAVLQAFAKRLVTFALQLHHNGALACLSLVHTLVQQSKPVSSIFESDESVGSGRYDPFISSPEQCGAHAASTHEVTLLRRHYHPTVIEAADVWRLPQSLMKLSPTQILEQYDGSTMSFKPAIPPPKQTDKQAKRTNTHNWAQPDFKEYCDRLEKSVDMNIGS